MRTLSESFELKTIKAIALTVAVTAVLDQLTKALVVHYFSLYDMVEVIPGFFNIVHWRNPGAAFGLFKEGGMVRTLLLAGVSFLALVIIGLLLRHAKDTITRVALSLIAGGAVGNLIDRLRFGEVIDFFDFYVGRYHWPAFNVADSAITVGVFLSLYLFYFKRPEGEKEE
jgi:signal peptidase II